MLAAIVKKSNYLKLTGNLSGIGRISYAIALTATGFQTIYYHDFPYWLLPPNHAWIPGLIAYIAGALIVFAGACTPQFLRHDGRDRERFADRLYLKARPSARNRQNRTLQLAGNQDAGHSGRPRLGFCMVAILRRTRRIAGLPGASRRDFPCVQELSESMSRRADLPGT